MNNELVKELASVRTWLAASDEYAIGVPSAEVSVAVIDRAIAFISSHDSVRDRALEEAAAWHSHTAQEMERVVNGLISAEAKVIQLAHVSAHDQSAAYFRALKSAPNTKEAPKMYERHKGKDGACLSADTRGTVEDRRKSALGEPLIGDNGKRVEQAWGRRSGDSARWTGEAAPVVECLSCGDTKKMPYEPLNPSSKTYPCPYCMPQQSSATQPAQEAPQSLVQWYRDEFTYLRDDPVTHRRIEHVLNKIDELREHDRRRGDK